MMRGLRRADLLFFDYAFINYAKLKREAEMPGGSATYAY